MSRVGKSSKERVRRAPRKRVQLAEVLDLTAAAPLAEALRSHRGTELSIDASQVQRVGAQCLQVLLAATATWKADGVRLCMVKPTEEFLEGGRLLGINLDQDTAEQKQTQ